MQFAGTFKWQDYIAMSDYGENCAMILTEEKLKYWNKNPSQSNSVHHQSHVVSPTFAMNGQLLRRLAADTAVRSVCLSPDALSSESQIYSHRSTAAASRASSHGAGRRWTTTWCKGASQCVLNQTANGALRDVEQTRHRRSLLSERHWLSQHTSQHKRTKFSVRCTHIVWVVTWPIIIIIIIAISCHCCTTICHYAFFAQQKNILCGYHLLPSLRPSVYAPLPLYHRQKHSTDFQEIRPFFTKNCPAVQHGHTFHPRLLNFPLYNSTISRSVSERLIRAPSQQQQ